MKIPKIPKNIPSDFCVEYTVTQDEVELGLGRYPTQGQPVILMHGFVQNYRVWDFPIVQHNFASYLYKKGYDVWLPCLRGHGSGLVQSGTSNSYDHIDDLAIYDVPAIISFVRTVTKRSPIWIGHSLGGMIIYMYLQGIHYPFLNQYESFVGRPSNGFRPPKLTPIGDSKIGQMRHQELKGVVTIGSPIRLAWDSHKLSFWESNKILPWIAKMKSLRKVSSRLPYIPIASLWNALDPEFQAPSLWKKLTRWSVSKIANSYLTSLLWYPPNMTHELIATLLEYSMNDITPGVLEQFADWAIHQTFRAYPGPASHVYSSSMDQICVPILVTTGNRDKIATHSIVYEEGYLKMQSKDKEYHCFEEFGHNDLCVGVKAPEVVYPKIENWIQRHV